MSLESDWFSERHADIGSAWSAKIKDKLFDEQSPYQHVQVYDTEGFGRLMVIDGCTMVSTLDNFLYHEMMSHPALFTHPDPKRVAIIGGGDCGTLREVLKHGRVTHALQVEIDERVTRLSEEFFPELCVSNEDSRAGFLFEDGIRWMREADPGSVDVIIIDSTDPIGPAEGLFTRAFYADCHRALGEEGILVQQSESPIYHMGIINPMRKAMYAAGFSDVRTLFFPQPTYPSGWWSATMAGKQDLAGRFREADAANKRFETAYYNAAIHAAALTVPEFFKQALE